MLPSVSFAPASRIISPRRKSGVQTTDIVDAVGATFASASSPRAGSESYRASQYREGSAGNGSGNMDEQRSIVSASQTMGATFDKLQPEAALAAFQSIESVLETHVLSQPTFEGSEPLREQLRVLKEQLDAVAEYVDETKKKRVSAVESAFGESFEEKKARLRKSSRYVVEDWDCVAFIVKSNDDLRQEVLCLQLIRQLQDIFLAAELPLRLLPYRIIATSASTGMIEYVKNATSLDALKKRPGYTTLANHFVRTYGAPDSERYKAAMANYVRSMAAYSLACHFLQIKDRHNGNIMIDSDGHVVHIDFGFILGIAPGGRFSLETAPFKLTAEMVEAMGGTQSEYFKAYVILLIQGFLALQVKWRSPFFLYLFLVWTSHVCFSFLIATRRYGLAHDRHHGAGVVVSVLLVAEPARRAERDQVSVQAPL
jgi:phosphatidylinositol 4-kinase B